MTTQKHTEVPAGIPLSDARGSDEVFEKWLGDRRRLSRQDIKELLEIARQHGGELVDFTTFGGDGDDDWCGTMWFKKPWPKVGPLIENLVERGRVVRVFPRGIPAINAIEVLVSQQAPR